MGKKKEMEWEGIDVGEGIYNIHEFDKGMFIVNFIPHGETNWYQSMSIIQRKHPEMTVCIGGEFEGEVYKGAQMLKKNLPKLLEANTDLPAELKEALVNTITLPEKVKRRLIRSFGRPQLSIKIYDKLGDDANTEALIKIMKQRKMNKYGFAGVGHISVFPDFGPIADIEVYGRSDLEKPEDVYPHSIVLTNGEDLPPEYGRMCLEETRMFGKEAELYLSLGHSDFKVWLERFAI
jgi:hypothetical protein